MLDELVAVIETLKSRIEAHRETLQTNETRTRVSLIDPLLCALGWDSADPGLVTLEFDVGGRRADYALLESQGKPLVLLEAKKLSESLSSHRSQMALYASELGIRYPALTNGNRWEVYDNSKMIPIEERRILDVSISEDDSAMLALKLLLLWRSNIAADAPIQAPEPIAGLKSDVLETIDGISKDETITSTSYPPSDGWTNLEVFQAVSGSQSPTTVRFSNGEERPTDYWSRILREVADYLVRKGLLSASACPIPAGLKSKRYLINTEPLYPNGKPFHNGRPLSNGLYLDVGYSASGCIKMSKYLLERLGQDPSKVWLKTG